MMADDTPTNVVALRPMTPETDGVAPDPFPRQCTAKSQRSGQRCRQHAIRGGTVCKSHGGAAPQVKERARLRLAALVEPAIATLAREMATAQNSRDRLKAADSILDRAGLSRGASAEVEVARALLIERLIAVKEAEQKRDAR